MKKNTMMRIASFLLIAVLLSTSAISGTYAKYVTKGEGNDSARVAKFGVSVTATSTMFATTYNIEDGTYNGPGSLAVESSTSDNLVAPGTEGTMVALDITGTPEVATRISYAPVVELGNNWIDKDDTTKFYCPIKVTIVNKNGTTVLCGLDYNSADEFETAIADNIIASTMDYEPNANLANVNDDLQISWEWPFVSDGTYAVSKQTDEKDTFLGDRAAAALANAGTIEIALTVTVTQID